MSFILDALKKSEAERQQQAGAAHSYVPSASGSGAAPRALLVVIGLLAGTVIVLLIVLLRTQQSAGERQRAAAPVPHEASLPSSPAPVPAPVAATPDSALPVARQTIPDRPVDAPVSTPEPDEARAPNPALTTNQAPLPQPVAAAPEPVNPVEPEVATTAPPSANETFLTFNELRATGKLGLPEMHIDLHVYSEKPSERFVFINMNQYRENATLTEGPRLRQIREDGVLLEYVGTTFLLPRE